MLYRRLPEGPSRDAIRVTGDGLEVAAVRRKEEVMRHRGLWVGGGVVFLVLATLGAEMVIVERRRRMVQRAPDRVSGLGRLVAVRAISLNERPEAAARTALFASRNSRSGPTSRGDPRNENE